MGEFLQGIGFYSFAVADVLTLRKLLPYLMDFFAIIARAADGRTRTVNVGYLDLFLSPFGGYDLSGFLDGYCIDHRK